MRSYCMDVTSMYIAGPGLCEYPLIGGDFLLSPESISASSFVPGSLDDLLLGTEVGQEGHTYGAWAAENVLSKHYFVQVGQ